MRLTQQLLEDAKSGKISLEKLMLSDQEIYNELNLMIQTKAGSLVPFKLNNVQRIFNEACERMLKETGRIRIIVLKGRQFGISTLIGSRMYKGCSTQFHQEGKVVAHDKEATLRLFKMYQIFFDNSLPQFRPMHKYRSKQDLNFANPTKLVSERKKNPGLQSTLSVYTAKATGIGRSATLRYLHCSEVPQWPTAQDTMLGLLNTVPQGLDGRGTEVYIESTAKGIGDFFWQKYYAAKNKDAGEEFWAVFLPWYLHDEYTLKVPEGFGEKDLLEDEKELAKDEHADWDYDNPATGSKRLSYGQILWRRQTIASVCNRNVEEFQQEYPLTDGEAFRASGIPFFDVKLVNRHMMAVKEIKEEFRGEIEWYQTKLIKDSSRKSVDFRFVKNAYGNLTIWRKPEAGELYAIGADVGEGSKGADESVIDIGAIRDGFHCAQWKGNIEPDRLADIFYMLGKYFNWAYGAPEINGPGLACMDRLRVLKYPKLFVEKVLDHRIKEETERMGWRTTIRSRYAAIDTFNQMFRDGDSRPNSLNTLMQMSTFVKINNKWQAQPGCHDDAVMSYAIMCVMLMDKPRRLLRRRENKYGLGFGVEKERRDPVTGFLL